MHEALALALIDMAERWAEACGTTLRNREHFRPTVFTVTRRPEERALLAAAVEVYDLVGATPEGVKVLRGLGLEPDAGALLEEDDLVERWTTWRASRVTSQQQPRAGSSAG